MEHPKEKTGQLDLYGEMDALSDAGVKARTIALDIIDKVLRRKLQLDQALERADGLMELESRDRAFTRLLVATVLRRLNQIDSYIEPLLDRPMVEIKPQAVLDVLRLGVVQMVFLETPVYAAVNTSVMLAEQNGMEHQKGFVNAVMRSLSRKIPEKMDSRDAGRLNTPDWLWYGWVNDYGVDVALQIAEANMKEAPVDFTVKEDPEYWGRQLDGQVMPNGTVRRLSGGMVTDLPGYDKGAWWVQGLVESLPAKLFGDLSGKTIVDLCAAPGGKTAQLIAAGANVIAVDRSAPRLKRLEENLERLDMEAEIVVADGAVWKPKELVDGVLLDAPCTATGTIRKQPDVMLLKTPDDLRKLAATQKRILENALQMLKPGGVLIYCTCSLQKEEGELQIEKIIEAGAPVSISMISPDEIGGMSELLDNQGQIRALPFNLSDRGGVDGFFVARLIRK